MTRLSRFLRWLFPREPKIIPMGKGSLFERCAKLHLLQTTPDGRPR